MTGGCSTAISARMRGVTPRVVVAAVFAAVATLAGCHRSSSPAHPTAQSIATIRQRYQAAVDPAHTALAAILKRALAYSGGSPTELDTAVPQTVNSLKTASRQLGGIAAPEPLHRDIVDVASTLNTLVSDLTTLGAAKGNDIQPGIARFVANAGREAAADNLVRLAIAELTTPTTLPSPDLFVAPTTVALTTRPSTTVPPGTTTTTRPSTSTTVARTTSTVARTTTTTRLTTTTTRLTTTTATP